jgi:hypothetical protein
MFPGEDDYISRVSPELGEYLQLGYATVKFCIEVITQRRPTVDSSSSSTAYRIGHSLCVRACKLLRASLELAQIGSDTELAILSRSLFETFVAANFVLRPVLTLRPMGKTTSALNCNDRALIYYGFQVVSRLRTFEQAQQHSWANQQVRAIDTSKAKAEIAEVATTIGSDWVQQFQKHPKTYSGLNLRELTEAIGAPCDGWYATMYGLQSKSIHATDADAHVSYSTEEQRFLAKWYPNPSLLRKDIVLATSMVWGCLDLLHQQFQFDGDTNAELKILLALLEQFESRS